MSADTRAAWSDATVVDSLAALMAEKKELALAGKKGHVKAVMMVNSQAALKVEKRVAVLVV